MSAEKPNLCESDGLLSRCVCADKDIKGEQKKCLAFKRGIKGYCSYYRSSIGACSNYDGCFSLSENQ